MSARRTLLSAWLMTRLAHRPIGPFAGHFYKEIHKLGGTVYLNPDGHEWILYIICCLAMLSSNLEGMECVRGIIDEGGYTSPLEMIEINSRDKLQSKFLVRIFSELVNIGARIWGRCNLRGVDACKALMNTKIPVLIIHGDKDTQAPVAMAYRLNNSCKSEKQMLIIRGAGHTDCYKIDPLRYENAVYEFIKNHIT